MFLERVSGSVKKIGLGPFSIAGCHASSFGHRYKAPIEKRFRSAVCKNSFQDRRSLYKAGVENRLEILGMVREGFQFSGQK